MNTRVDTAISRVYAFSVTAHSVIGIRISRARAHKRSSEALFLRPRFMAGVIGASSDAPVLLPGNANPVASATLLIRINGGGSRNPQEDTTMTHSNLPVVFTFTDKTVRVVVVDDAPWFVAADVCAALGIETHVALRRLDDDEKGRYSTPTPGGQQEMTVINESGLYSLILGSRKPEAKKFKKWVTAEVLPAIRKTGHYEAAPALPATITLAQQGILFNLLCDRFPEGKDRPYAWSRFNNHFALNSYKNLPASQFEEACAYIPTMPVKKPLALPAAQQALSDALRQAINRKAHGLALESFDAVREALHAQVASWATVGLSEADILERLHDHHHDLVLIHAADLWLITSHLAGIKGFIDTAVETIHHLEKSTGRNWYGRARSNA